MKTVFAIYLTLAGFIMIPSMGVFFTGHKEEKKVETNLGKAERDSIKISTFLIEMADARLMSLEEAKLAAEKGSSPEIRNYGLQVMNDQYKMLEQLKFLARQRRIQLPVAISMEKAKALDTLKGKNGEDFDRKFMRMMKIDHKRDIKMCKKIKKVNNEGINIFVNEYQPIMEIHLQRLKLLRSGYIK